MLKENWIVHSCLNGSNFQVNVGGASFASGGGGGAASGAAAGGASEDKKEEAKEEEEEEEEDDVSSLPLIHLLWRSHNATCFTALCVMVHWTHSTSFEYHIVIFSQFLNPVLTYLASVQA